MSRKNLLRLGLCLAVVFGTNLAGLGALLLLLRGLPNLGPTLQAGLGFFLLAGAAGAAGVLITLLLERF